MNREQMIAWLTLEGYVGQKSAYWNGLQLDGNTLTYMYLDQRRDAEPYPTTTDHGGAHLEVLVVPFSELPDLEQLTNHILEGKK